MVPFANLHWWKIASEATIIQLDIAEHFEKMSFRNRYYIATAHGKHCLSIPIENGRNHRVSMNQIKISYAENWQQLHWRTIYSAYNRSPYFEYFKDDLYTLYERPYETLVEFNLAGMHWLKEKLNCSFEEQAILTYQRTYENSMDTRQLQPKDETNLAFPRYHQVFQERNGFIPNLSMLDLLFNEGRYAKSYLDQITST